jgi:hypothetical protein
LRFGPPSTRALFPPEVETGSGTDAGGSGEVPAKEEKAPAKTPTLPAASLEFRSPVAVAKPGKRFALLSTAD